MKKPQLRVRQREVSHEEHRHGKGRCLNILKQLSAYLDNDLSDDVCAEIRKHIGACPNCEVFVASLRHTIHLCQHHPTHPLTAAERAALRRQILKAAASA